MVRKRLPASRPTSSDRIRSLLLDCGHWPSRMRTNSQMPTYRALAIVVAGLLLACVAVDFGRTPTCFDSMASSGCLGGSMVAIRGVFLAASALGMIVGGVLLALTVRQAV